MNSFDNEVRKTVMPTLDDLGYSSVHIFQDHRRRISQDYDGYRRETHGVLRDFKKLIPRAVGLLVVNNLPNYHRSGMQTTHKEALRAHGSLWVAQAILAWDSGLPRFAMDLSINPDDTGETVLRMQLKALGTVDTHSNLEKILDVLDPPQS